MAAQTRRIPHVINGRQTESADGATFTNVNPWTRQPHNEVALGGRADAERAVDAARSAFDTGPWPHLHPSERAQRLHRLADLIDEHRDELALADTRDMGKPLTQSSAVDVPRSAGNFRFFADHASLSVAETFPTNNALHAYSRYEPAGVVAAISPWNYPLMLETWKVAPALAWGNTVVLKPAEDSPTSGFLLATLALEAGLPAGVLNTVQGYGPDGAGEALARSSHIDRVAFTGESTTGRAISRAAGDNLVPVSLELGGKNANVVFDDADIAGAVGWSVRAGFGNSGQMCLAGSRIYVHRDVAEAFTDQLVSAALRMRVGDPEASDTELGPLASQAQADKVQHYLDLAHAHGKVLAGGTSEGWSVWPTVVTELDDDSPLHREEVFGPVVVVSTFDSEDEVVDRANDTPYGLTATVFTRDLARGHRMAARLRAGTVWLNCFQVRDLRAPFGGVGRSGIGREGGDFSRDFFTEPKMVAVGTGS